MTDPPVVFSAGLIRRFGFFRALDGVDFEARPAETVLLLGSNGAGKTTFFRVLAGLLVSNGGTCRVFGRSPRSDGGVARSRIGFLSHSLALYPDLTAEENLRFFARLYRVAGARNRVRSLLDEVGLADWAEEPARNFSRGMKQRLALARVFLHRPELYLLDEPFTGLDLASAKALASRLDARKKEGATVLLASHRLETVAPLGDRVVYLSKGRVGGEIDFAGGGIAERTAKLRAPLGGES